MPSRFLTGIVALLIANLISDQTPHSLTKASTHGFIENKGQIIDQDNQLNPEVLYLLNTPGFNVQLRKGGFSYDVYTPKSPEGDFSRGRHQGMKAWRHQGIRHKA